jgi:hypothetical protein
VGRYTDEQVQAAIDELRAGGEPLPEDVLPELTDPQVKWYFAALEREEFAVMCRWRKAWLSGEPGVPQPPFPVFEWARECPDFPPDDLLTGDE